MLARGRLAAAFLSVGKLRVAAHGNKLRYLSSTNAPMPAFTSPPPPPRDDMTLVGPLGPLRNQDVKTSTESLSIACK